jgi:ubiquinone/menaquinone biosynthesis C-methylase UbiE
MTQSSQRQIFLDGEGDAWYERNHRSSLVQREQWQEHDPLAQLLAELPLPRGSEVSALEVGCGQGLRLLRMEQEFGWQVAGVDPSSVAVEAVLSMGLKAHVATADALPLPDASVDLLIYGFCLYLCDRSDLFKIAAEAHRVLKPESWLVMLDFWSRHQISTPYHHCSGVFSYKDDLPAMFSWHPSYVITDHRLRRHASHVYTDNPREWVAATILRRFDLTPSSSHD